MFTSLAPSPIDKVTFFGYLFLIIFTISAFYLGDTLHARTTSALSEHFRNVLRSLSTWSITVSEAPATIIDYFLFWQLLIPLKQLSSWSDKERSETASIMCLSMFSSKRPAETPIFIAVSILSPVKTHTLIPVYFINYIVLATWSYSLSSIAVEPIKSISTSILASTSATFASRSLISNFALAAC